MSEANIKFAGAQMLIRKPVAEVFEAFIDPTITRHFWFTKGSDRLEENKTITWEWEMYNFSTQVIAQEIIPHKKIRVEWYTSEKPTIIDFQFQAIGEAATYISIKHYGFNKEGDELLEAIKDSTEGFTIVLAGLKAYLEHGINLNLIADKFPKEL